MSAAFIMTTLIFAGVFLVVTPMYIYHNHLQDAQILKKRTQQHRAESLLMESFIRLGVLSDYDDILHIRMVLVMRKRGVFE